MTKIYHLIIHRLLWLALIGLGLMLISQLFGRQVWQLELFSHYVPHVTAVLLLVAVFYPKKSAVLSQKLGRTVIDSPKNIYLPIHLVYFAAGAGVALCLSPWSLWHFWHTQPEQGEDSTVNIAYQNVNIATDDPKKTLTELINAQERLPDVLLLLEAGGERWQTALADIENEYVTQCGMDDNNPFAMQVYAKDANAQCAIQHIEGFPMAKLRLSDERMIYLIHPPPPINADMAKSRNIYLEELATLIQQQTTSQLLVVGDFNTSAFSPTYRDFIRQALPHNHSLERTTMKGLPTWLPFGIGIDHVLTTDANEVQTISLGWHGSDHRGFVVRWSDIS